MRRNSNLTVCVLLSLFVCSACSEKWLKPDPLSFHTPENTYINPAGFDAILVTLRKDLNYDFTGNRNPMAMEFAYSDLAIALFQADFNRNTPSSSQFWPLLTFFNRTYRIIKNANVLISRIDDISWDEKKQRDMMLAEAYWHRAYWYYRLVHSYGDVPWVGEEANGAKLDYVTYSRWAILEKIQTDLEFAKKVLPITGARLGDVTKGAVNHLLTKIYLANGEFDKAIQSSTEVIEGPYALMIDRFGKDKDESFRNVVWDLHRPENKNSSENTETIYTTVDRPDAPPETWSDGAYTMRNFVPAWWKITDGTGERACNWDTPTGDTLGQGNGDVRTNNYYHYQIWNEGGASWEATTDLRRADINWIDMGDQIAEIKGCKLGSPMEGKPLSKNTFTDLNDTTDTWYPWPIYKTYIPTPNLKQPRGGQSDMYVFRLAETYLLRAEAHYWNDQLNLAANDINKVRQRAKALPVNAKEVTLDYIFDERARELYIEEPRHSEMIRVSFLLAKLNREGYSLESFHEKNWCHDRIMRVNTHYHSPLFSWYGNIASIKPHHSLWPIPQDVITENTKGKINQNIGYFGAENNISPIERVEN